LKLTKFFSGYKFKRIYEGIHMKIKAIKQVRSGKNICFITDEIQEYDLDSILELGERGALENATVVTTKTGKQYLRSKANTSEFDNLDTVAITCNEKDYLLFDRKYIYLKAQNGRVKKKWVATSGKLNATISDQNKKDFGPLPEGDYTVKFSATLDYKNNTSLWDKIKWLWKSPAWGFVATPLEPSPKNEMVDRGNFYIHGGNEPGSEGCIDLTNKNQNFHTFLRLYKRDVKLIVKYK